MRIASSERYWSEIQKRLSRHGFDPGPIDGRRGDMTDGALIRFKASRNLRPRPYVGLDTEEVLMMDPQDDGGDAPRWLAIARGYLGLREIPGARHHPQIVSWWSDINAGWFDDDETPWCGAFVGGVLAEAGVPILARDGARARAWESWGRALDGPAVGAVVTFFRGGRDSKTGHVAFVIGRSTTGRIVCLGGNQADAVTIAEYDVERGSSWGVSAYRWPEEHPLPPHRHMAELPIVSAIAGGQVT